MTCDEYQYHTTAPVTLNGEPREFVEDFTYLGILFSKDDGAQKYMKAKLDKARCAFAKLQIIWKSNQFTRKTNGYCRIFWPNELSKVEQHKRTGSNSDVLEIKR